MSRRFYLINHKNKKFYQLEDFGQSCAENFAIWFLGIDTRSYYLHSYPPYQDKKYSFGGIVRKSKGIRSYTYKVTIPVRDYQGNKVEQQWKEDYEKEIKAVKERNKKLEKIVKYFRDEKNRYKWEERTCTKKP